MDVTDTGLSRVAAFLERCAQLHSRYRAGRIRASVPDGLRDGSRPLDSVVAEYLPRSQRALEAAARGLFYSLPVAFDPDYATWRAYANHAWPAFYFIGRDGRIRHTHVGEGDYAGSEAVIRALVAAS